MGSFHTSLELDSGEEVEVYVEFDYSPIIPARTSCLPEDATPAEGGEVSIDKIVNVETGEEIDQATLSNKDLNWLKEKIVTNLEDFAEEERLNAKWPEEL